MAIRRSNRLVHRANENHTVLVPIFGSDITDDAFSAAQSLLERPGTRLVLLHVVPSETNDAARYDSAPPPAAEPRWHRLATTSAAHRTFVEVVRGDPVEEVLQEADRFGSDVIVVGPAAPDASEGWIERAITQLARAAPRRVRVTPRRNRSRPAKLRPAALRRRIFGHRRFDAT